MVGLWPFLTIRPYDAKMSRNTDKADKGIKSEKREERRGSAGPRALAGAIAQIAKPILGRRGFAQAAIVTDWPAIAGPALATRSLPMRVQYPAGSRAEGTLQLRVADGAMAMQVAHLEPLILERINAYFGYKAVARIAIFQGPIPRRPESRAVFTARLGPEEEARLKSMLDEVTDTGLRDALEQLGRSVLSKR